MKSKYVPGWIIDGRNPSWLSDGEQSNFGTAQYLWGNMPAVNILNGIKMDGICDSHRDADVLFAASGDIRNVIKSVVEGLPDQYNGRCMLAINDINFTVIARNAILLFIALSLEPEEAVPIMIHVWYSALLPRTMIDTLRRVALGPIMDVCEKIKDRPSTSLQAKNFTFGQRTLRIVLKRHQWDDLTKYFDIPSNLTLEDAQFIRRRVMLAPERIDYLHRALCNQTPPIRVATVTFREDGILLPHGASRKEFDTPNTRVSLITPRVRSQADLISTFFDKNKVWPMLDDACPLQGWDYNEYMQFAPKARNDVMGSFFFFLRHTFLRFCRRIRNVNVQFQLFNVDARELHCHVSKYRFDCIEVGIQSSWR